jgi:uncharacterized membrane protein
MSDSTPAFVAKFFAHELDRLSERERAVISHFGRRAKVSRNTNREFDDSLSFGQRLADAVAKFGGSWTFILVFAAVLFSWVALNSLVLARSGASFDPYPYILLNLVLSMVAALQAPIIMMSQNRQAAKDRLDAAHDYEVNLKAELDIIALHEKVDELRDRQWQELLSLQHEQIQLLTQLLASRDTAQRTDDPS